MCIRLGVNKMNLETVEESVTYDLTDGTPIYTAEFIAFQRLTYYNLLYSGTFKISDIDLCFAFSVYPHGCCDAGRVGVSWICCQR